MTVNTHSVFMRKLLLVILLSILAMTVRASGEVYRVGVENLSYYPLMDFNNEQSSSILKRIMEEFARSEGITFEFIPLPIQRFHEWYDGGAIDFRLPDNPYWTSQLDPDLKYSELVITLCADVVTLAENQHMPAGQFTKLDTLYGFLPDKKWEEAVNTGEVELVTDSSLKVLTRMLLNGMVDGLDLHISTIQREGAALGEPAQTFAVSTAFAPSTLGYRLSTRQHPEVLARFNTYLANEQNTIRHITDAFSFQQGCPD
ncbi:hypothetical protein [Alteromonas halophila]|uniref:Solute-binding protein family 3/N-terminal domain-containing protein n=1 Tax=Alteromonas halophila TaxID=516698 RepID=A0A918JFN6_9ALTE|nr:hypothetical protein [Alteromonas halophila]GGW75450.1 hypothetical protein GCM10007391_04660 [Alteromonas halophila]